MKSQLTKKGKRVQIADISVIVLVEEKTNNMFSHSDIVTAMWVPVHFWFEHLFSVLLSNIHEEASVPSGVQGNTEDRAHLIYQGTTSERHQTVR